MPTEIRTSPAVGARLTLSVERLSLGGDGVGRIDGCVVFVPYGCPGDVLAVDVTESHRTYARARVVRVVSPSPQRIAPPCRYHFSPEGRVPRPEWMGLDNPVN